MKRNADACKALLNKNAKVYLMARSESKALPATEDIKQETRKSDVHFIRLDLGDLPSVKQAAAEFLQ